MDEHWLGTLEWGNLELLITTPMELMIGKIVPYVFADLMALAPDVLWLGGFTLLGLLVAARRFRKRLVKTQ